MSVNLSERDNVAILTIDRPESLNALSFAILHRIGELLDEVARSRARALIGWLAMETGAATLTAVADRFGREASGMSRQVVALRDEANADPKIAKDLQAHLNAITHA